MGAETLNVRFWVLVNSAMCVGVLDESDHARERFALAFDIMRAADCRADVQPPDDHPRRTCVATEAGHDGDQCGCNAGLLQSTGDQTHGLMADRS